MSGGGWVGGGGSGNEFLWVLEVTRAGYTVRDEAVRVGEARKVG